MVGFLAIAAVLAIAPPAPALDDVPGWQNTNWGMTELEVKGSLESLGLPLTPLPPPYGRSLRADAPFKTTVEIAGGRVDIHSGSCADPAMVPLVDGAVPAFKAAGFPCHLDLTAEHEELGEVCTVLAKWRTCDPNLSFLSDLSLAEG